MRWSPERLDQLERAARESRRVMLVRRGTEYVVVAIRVTARDSRDVLIGRNPMTGEEMAFSLGDIESLMIL